MKTISVSPEDMEARIARFQNLKPIAAMQNDKFRWKLGTTSTPVSSCP